jgi:hypothetical protein
MTGRALRNESPGVPPLTSPSRHIGKVLFFFLGCLLTTGPCVLHCDCYWLRSAISNSQPAARLSTDQP